MKATEQRNGRSFDVRRHVLPNGLIVLLVDNPSIPAVSLSVSVLSGRAPRAGRKGRTRLDGQSAAG